MRNYLLVLLIIFGQGLLAQKFDGFFIEPGATLKFFTSKASNNSIPMETSYFRIETLQFPTRQLYFGLNLGYNFKNNDKLQLGIAGDESAQGFRIYGLSKYSYGNNTYSYTTYKQSAGVLYKNLSLIFKRNILFMQSKAFNKDRFIRLHLNFGVTYCFKNNKDAAFIVPGGIDVFRFLAYDSSNVIITATTFDIGPNFKNRFKFNVGIDFTFGKKEKEWFNLNIAFITNRSNNAIYSSTNVEIDVVNSLGKKRYSYSVRGAGNGVYFTLSKRIYPFKMITNKRKKQMDAYIKEKAST